MRHNEKLNNVYSFLSAIRMEWMRQGKLGGRNMQKIFEVFHVGRTPYDIIERFIAEPITEETAQRYIEAAREYRRKKEAEEDRQQPAQQPAQQSVTQPTIDFEGVERCEVTDEEFKTAVVSTLRRIADALESFNLNH